MRVRVLTVVGAGLLIMAGLVLLGLPARQQALAAQQDLTSARTLLERASSFNSGTVSERLALVDQATERTGAARRRLGSWPLAGFAKVPLLGRDVRVAQAVADAAGETVQATRGTVAEVAALETQPLTAPLLTSASDSMRKLGRALAIGAARVQETRPLLLSREPRRQYLEASATAARTTTSIGRGLDAAAKLYGPRGRTRYLLAFQNPAELRGTGGLIGDYGVVQSSPAGPELTTVNSYGALNLLRRRTSPPTPAVPDRYAGWRVDQDWSAVNIPADMPTVGGLAVAMYAQATGARLEGVIAIDPLAVADILRVTGPITLADGQALGDRSVAKATMVDAYVRFAGDRDARKAYLEQIARATFASLRRAMSAKPIELVRELAKAAQGRHLQVYSTDEATQQSLLDLGIAGSIAAPAGSDYLMLVGVNAGGNKLDAYTRRTLNYSVRVDPSLATTARAEVVLRNTAPRGLPSVVFGPFSPRFAPGENRQALSLYLADRAGFTKATQDGEPVGIETHKELGSTVLWRQVSVPAGKTVKLAYSLKQPGAVQLSGELLRYRLVVRPQATFHPDTFRLSVAAPSGWRFVTTPTGGSSNGPQASWAGPLDRERHLEFLMARSTG